MPPLSQANGGMSVAHEAYVEHVAVWVKDIHWHIRFFRDVLRHDDARGGGHA